MSYLEALKAGTQNINHDAYDITVVMNLVSEYEPEDNGEYVLGSNKELNFYENVLEVLRDWNSSEEHEVAVEFELSSFSFNGGSWSVEVDGATKVYNYLEHCNIVVAAEPKV